MVDEAGDIVMEVKTRRIGEVTKVKGDKVRVRFTDTEQFRKGFGAQEVNLKKKDLISIREAKDRPGFIRRAEATP